MSEIKSTVVGRLSDILTSGKFGEIQFVFQNGNKVKGHKLIYAIASPVFEAMMYGDLAENENEIKIDDVEPYAFKTMTEYIYTDKLRLNSIDHAISVYKAGDKYDLPNLTRRTIEYVKLNVDTEHTLQTLEFSELYDIPSIKAICLKILRENTRDVLLSSYASKCCILILKKIVECEKLKVPEVELFKFVENWAKCYAENNDVKWISMKRLLTQIISKIRFRTMTVTDFLSFPFKSQLLSVEEKQSLLFSLNEPESVALPDDFCNSTIFRDPGEEVLFSCLMLNCKQYLIRWRLKNAIRMSEKYFSPNFYIGGNPFKIFLNSRILEGYKKYIGLFLRYDWEEKPCDAQWYCSVEFNFKLSIKGREPITAETAFRCFNNQNYTNGWGFMKFCEWTAISNEVFSKGDCILIEVDLKIV